MCFTSALESPGLTPACRARRGAGCGSSHCFGLDSCYAPTVLLVVGWARMKASLHWEVHLLPAWGSQHALAEDRLSVGCLAIFFPLFVNR